MKDRWQCLAVSCLTFTWLSDWYDILAFRKFCSVCTVQLRDTLPIAIVFVVPVCATGR
jgi:hypothetical protein